MIRLECLNGLLRSHTPSIRWQRLVNLAPRRLVLASGACLAALLNAHYALAGSSELQLSDQQITQLEDLATRGQAACEAQQFGTCHSLFKQAQTILPWPPHEYYLGEALVGLGRLTEGTRIWHQMLAANADPNDPVVNDAVRLARKRLKDVELTIPSLFFQVPYERRDNVSVRLDGRALPASDFDRELPLDPGNHVFELSETGHTKELHTVTLELGVHQRVLVALQPLLPPPPPAAPEPETSWRVPVGWSLSALGAGAMVGSLVLYLNKESLNRKLEQDCGQGDKCGLELDEFEQRSDVIRDKSVLVNVMLFGGAGLAALGAGALVWNAVDSDDPQSRTNLSIVAAPNFSGFWLNTRF